MGITTLTELVEAPFTLLKDEFGYQTASTMQRLCQGHDESPVVQSGPPQVPIHSLRYIIWGLILDSFYSVFVCGLS